MGYHQVLDLLDFWLILLVLTNMFDFTWFLSCFFISMFFYFEFQQLYRQWQELKYSNIKPVTVKEV